MKINETQRVGPINPYRRNADAYTAHTVNKKEKQKDEVQISSEALELLGAKEVESAQGVRSQKLEDLKQAVSTGTYHVDARKIAEKLWPFVK